MVSRLGYEVGQDAREVISVPLTGVQDGDLGRNWPQPLGVFCNARTHPHRYSGGHVLFEKVLDISRSGLLMGLVDGGDYRIGGDDLVENGLAPTDDMEDVWACGLRLTRHMA